MTAFLPLGSSSADFDLLRPIRFQPLQFDFQDAVGETRLDLVGIDPERELDRARESAVGTLAALPINVLLLRLRFALAREREDILLELRFTSSLVTPGNSAVRTTLFSPSQMLIGGKSRAAVALNPEKTRFISPCIRRSSANGSKPNLGNSESAMVHLSACLPW
jgi:hypothetical protein